MKLIDITTVEDVFPGEYVFHEPTSTMGLCGGSSKNDNTLKVLLSGKLVEDVISNFKKMSLTPEEARRSRAGRCKGCTGG